MMADLEQRLRLANPVSLRKEEAPEDLLRRILSEPRVPEKAKRRRARRRPVVLLAAAVVLLGGTAAGVSRFAVDYFGSDDAEPTPAAVIAELRQLNLAAGADIGTIAAQSYVRLAAFDGRHGRVTIYIAATEDGAAYCMASAEGSVVDGGSCSKTARPEMAIPYGNYWNSNAGDAHILYGRVPASVGTIDVRFEDGAIRAAGRRGPWWIYVVGGGETKSGERPTELIARRTDGAIALRQKLDPYDFWNKEEFEAAVPESDGSPGQEAVRAAVLDLGPSGGRAGTDLELDKTYLVKTVQTSRGSFDVYAAPAGEGRVCFGYDNKALSFEHTTSGCPNGTYAPGQGGTFNAAEIQVFVARAGFATVDGLPPRGAAKITVSFEDGTSAQADISTRSYFAFWFGSDRLVSGARPRRLVAWNGEGRAIDSFEVKLRQSNQ